MSSKSSSRLWSRLAVRGAPAPTEADARTLLQRRVTLFFLVQVALSGLMLLWTLARSILEHGAAPDAIYASSALPLGGNGAVVVVFFVLWQLCKRQKMSSLTLHILEGSATMLVCSWVALALTVPSTSKAIVQGSVVGWEMFLVAVIILVARAALVPSSAGRSLLIGIFSVLPVSLTLHVAQTSGAHRPFLSLPSEAVWIFIGFGVSFVVVTAVTSHTIYGLQVLVREAMQLGQYTLEMKLGEGGMGVVYRARHAMMRRPTAVKLLLSDKADEQSLARFEREVRLTAKLTHPNTITVFDYGRTAEGTFYYAMELLDGATLDEVVKHDGPQPAARVVRVLHMVAGALAEAHAIGLIHRDIKPANIILCKQGGELDVAKVLDFGLVKTVRDAPDAGMTQEGRVYGTPWYMAPEALTAPKQVDGRTDLYALGAVGYFLLTGGHLFPDRDVMTVCSHQIRTVPEPPSARLGSPVPADLEALVMACLEKDPAARPHDAAELKRRLDACRNVGEWDASHARAWWDTHRALLGDGRRAESETDVDAPTERDAREPPPSETATTVRVAVADRY